ncbi:MAG TPA: hypothetical protein VMF89_21955, partial [Polyangiales bacterium]|nr:hypothetical protein [Polyangiales bacterium]
MARSACAPESGFRALARASADTRGQRQLFLGVELLALLGLLLVFGNLYALTALALLVASSVLGLDVGFVTALIAPDNEIVPLLLLGVATLGLEPLRAAISALAFQRARERWEGADLHAAIAALTAEPRSRPNKAAARAVLVLLTLCAPAITHAQPPDAQDGIGSREPRPRGAASDATERTVRARDAAGVVGENAAQRRHPASDVVERDAVPDVGTSGEAAGDGAERAVRPHDGLSDVGASDETGSAAVGRVDSADVGAGDDRARARSDLRGRDALADVGANDARARERARAILARDEFLPSSMDPGEGSWRRWLAEHMRDRELSDRDASAPPRFELRLPSSVLVLGSVLLMGGVG